jgi:8-oxo-dGTP pyrophosphatase MutT (NUDIX family)
MRIKVIAKAVIQNADGQVLLMRRSATDPRRPGEWDFPGGAVEAGEELSFGAAREIQEEAGLVINPADLRLLFAATEPYEQSGESVTRLLFAGRAASDAVTLSFEHDEYKWVDIATALQDFPHPFYARGLAYARDHQLL